MNRKVVVTGMGAISGLGVGAAMNWDRTVRGDGAIRPVEPALWKDEPDFTMAGVAAWLDPNVAAAGLPTRDLRRLGRLDQFSRYALIAAEEAVAQAGIDRHPALAQRTAIIVGCGSNGNATVDQAYERLFVGRSPRAHPQTIPTSMISAPSSHVAMMLGVHGPTFVLSSACASSTHALGEAMHMIRAGRVDVAIAGGTEACITLGPWSAWRSLGVLAPDTCRPFSVNRQGMVLGEGAAMFVLESEEHALARGATILGEIAGYGATSDAAQITAPQQATIEMAIRGALADAGVAPSQPALISAHGTGTPLNDRCEAAALRAVYGVNLAGSTVIATKSAHGHLIGASGALQFLLGLKALAAGIAPPIINHLGADPECDLPLALTATSIDSDVLVSNSFAFGGLNAVLVGRRA
jgi:nodulation protein E